MRRIASVFASKRDRESVAGSEPPLGRSTSTLSVFKRTKKRATLQLEPVPHPSALNSTPSTPVLSTASSEHPHSSASSASTSLRTPDDDHLPPTKSTKSWKSWLANRASSSRVLLARPENWAKQPATASADADNSDSESDEDDYGGDDNSLKTPSTVRHHVPSPLSISSTPQRREYFEIITRNRLGRELSLSPYILPYLGLGPIFPRSSNTAGVFPMRNSLYSRLVRRNILRRLSFPLNGPDELLLETLHPKSVRVRSDVILSIFPEDDVNESLPKHGQTSLTSVGVQRWINRPCYEDRFVSYTFEDGSFKESRISSSHAVAALEYSESLDIMAGENASASQSGPLFESPSNSSEYLTPTSVLTPTPSPYTPSPSPLRNEHEASPSEPKEKTPQRDIDPDPEPSLPISASTITVKRGVRFAEDNKDELPLGYVVRKQQQKVAKARFLQEQKDKRIFEEERKKALEERRRREQERAEWESERKQWEQEKRAMEDERKQRLYAAEVSAARQRRENSRAGGGNSPRHLTPSGSASSLREPEKPQDSRRIARPAYDGRRRGSDSPGSHGSSPGSSRPPSLVVPTPGESSKPNHSRPSSLYSSNSSDETRPIDNKSKHLVASSTGHSRAPSDRSSTLPTMGSNFIPPVPPVPQFLDMPLTPPTPPFVLQQYPRPRHHSSSPSRQKLPSSSSTEKLPTSNRTNNRRDSSSSPRRPEISPNSSSSKRQSYHGHQRNSSGETRHSSLPTSLSVHERGRSQPNSQSKSTGYPMMPMPMPQQGMNPWMAMPSQYGMMPANWVPQHYATMPRPPPDRRQTTFS